MTDTAHPNVLIFWRFFITFLSFIPIVMVTKEKLKINMKQLGLLLLSAALLVLYNQFFFTGLKTGMAGGGGVFYLAFFATTFATTVFFLGPNGLAPIKPVRLRFWYRFLRCFSVGWYWLKYLKSLRYWVVSWR